MIHNLPASLTDDKLRQICRDAAGKLATITECRIWRDSSKMDLKVGDSASVRHYNSAD